MINSMSIRSSNVIDFMSAREVCCNSFHASSGLYKSSFL